ncbi:MAG: DUF460 domain-containing protein [Crenarchaeota archaeon]|nr:DUF460 domain-containing protein [Thermoproteota archaeon]
MPTATRSGGGAASAGCTGCPSLLVMGVDVEPGTPRRYSVAVVEGGALVAKYESVPLRRLLRLIWEYRPRILALDNVYELARNERELAHIVSMMPDDLEIVQVTRSPDGSFHELRSLAAELGIEVGSKLTPGRTAYLAALLAERGYGSRIRFVENKTRIIIRRGRSVGTGGMSQFRYQRRLRAAILRATRRIKERLDRSGLDYDLVFRKSGGGLDSAVFIVYAPRDKLYGIVKPHHGRDIVIDVRPVYSSHIVFEAAGRQASPRRFLIVGIDPGISTAVAAIDINGTLVFTESRRSLDRQEIVSMIYRHGHPVLIATDVKPAPDMVKKLASMLRVPLYEPPNSMSVEEKQEIVEEYLSRSEVRVTLDSHQRDALAAALKAYQVLEPKLRQAESHVARLGLDIDRDAVKAWIIKGASIAEAIENELEKLVNGSAWEEVVVKRRRVQRQEREEGNGSPVNERLLKTIEELEAENRTLRRRLRELQETIKRLEADYWLLKNEFEKTVEVERRVAELRRELEQARRLIDELRRENMEVLKTAERVKKLSIMAGRGQVVIGARLRRLSREELRSVKNTFTTLHGIPVCIDEAYNAAWSDAAEALVREGVAFILLPGDSMKYAGVFEEKDIPVLREDGLVIDKVGELCIVDPAAYIDAARRLEELRARRSRERRVSKEDILKLFREYRLKRMRELLKDADLAADELPC